MPPWVVSYVVFYNNKQSKYKNHSGRTYTYNVHAILECNLYINCQTWTLSLYQFKNKIVLNFVLSILCLQVGMDKAINNLSVPLGQLKEEVLVGYWNAKTWIEPMCENNMQKIEPIMCEHMLKPELSL